MKFFHPQPLLHSTAMAFFVFSLQFAHADDPLPAAQTSETKEHRDARMAWWREARFGMFIHWGLYSVPAGVWHGKDIPSIGEWIMHNAQIPVAEYKALAPQFNPTDFDAEAWVALAKAAGMKYIVITAKHHDGFAMFHSKVDPFNIYDATPFKRDPLQELARACQKQGIKLGFYYSQDQDWTAPGGASLLGGHWDKAQDGDFATYLKTKAIPQMRELLNNYQPAPVVIWFDTPTADMTPELAGQILALLKDHPNMIWNNRLGGGDQGDTETPEQTIPANGFPGHDWETCMTINDTWGFKSTDTNFKSSETLLRNLIDIASKGGNYLLNVGPTSKGVIPQPEADRLLAIGQWLKVNGEAIYGTAAGPFKQQFGWGRITQKPGKLYLEVFDWPKEGKLLLPISNTRFTARLLASGSLLEAAATPEGWQITLPANAPDPIASVIAIEIDGPAIPMAAASP
jgi:alpha-L-fucosidase